jgi:hypothetical protein
MRKGPRTLTILEQFLDVRQHFSGVTVTRGSMTVPLRPTPLSPTYHVRIDYRPEKSPRVFVVRPSLTGNPPHVYREGNLCLYWHDYDNTMSFRETIVPWTAEWLYFYELWQTCGQWLAPEAPQRGAK